MLHRWISIDSVLKFMLFTGRVDFGVCGTSTWVLGCPENFLENVGIFIYKGGNEK